AKPFAFRRSLAGPSVASRRLSSEALPPEAAQPPIDLRRSPHRSDPPAPSRSHSPPRKLTRRFWKPEILNQAKVSQKVEVFDIPGWPTEAPVLDSAPEQAPATAANGIALGQASSSIPALQCATSAAAATEVVDHDAREGTDIDEDDQVVEVGEELNLEGLVTLLLKGRRDAGVWEEALSSFFACPLRALLDAELAE
ncbi:unnamed protein product, partial [Symbiodinium necroappetens]